MLRLASSGGSSSLGRYLGEMTFNLLLKERGSIRNHQSRSNRFVKSRLICLDSPAFQTPQKFSINTIGVQNETNLD
jgi:hypothetical protein